MSGFDIVEKDALRVSAIDKDCLNKWSWTWICMKLDGDGRNVRHNVPHGAENLKKPASFHLCRVEIKFMIPVEFAH